MMDIPPDPTPLLFFFFFRFGLLETGRRRRKRRRGRRGWGGNRTSKLGGGEQLRRGELLADEEEEEELEDKHLEQMELDDEGVQVPVPVGIKEEDKELSCGAWVKEGLVIGMAGVECGGGGAGLVKEETRKVVVEEAGVKAEVAKVEKEDAGVGAKQELELDEDAFSDDDLL